MFLPQAGVYYLWVKDYNDRKHPAESRAVDILVDGRKAASLAATDSPGKENWGWHIASRVELSAGNHILMLKKQATTPAAALIEAFYLTTDPSDHPRQ